MRRLRRVLGTAIFISAALVSEAEADESASLVTPPPTNSYGVAYRLADPIPHLYTLGMGQSYDRGIRSDGKGHEFTSTATSTLPLRVGEHRTLFVHPVVPYLWMNGSEDGNVAGFGSPRIETFLSLSQQSRNEFKIGPLAYIPALSGSAFDPTQTGAGVSAVGILRPHNWALGVYGYQSFALGGSDTGGTVNFTYAQPFVSYVTEQAWTYTLELQSLRNWDSSGVSNPLYLNVTKTVAVSGRHISFSLGSHYYLSSSTYDYASGFGGNFSISFVLGKE
jgi:hypothetical protein